MNKPHMYGTSFPAYPQRIVCLTAETAETVYALGAGDRVVGVSGATTLAEAREKPKIGGFTSFKLEKILSLRPDLVLAFSDLQRDIVRDLVGAGVTVLALNQRSLEEVYRAILLIGGVLGREEAARGLIRDFQDEVRQVREYSSVWPDRPRVFFEEWDDPLISGITWVSELIEIAGGRDIFPELRAEPMASGRVVDPQEVIRRDPQIVIASWCGKKVDPEKIRQRTGWDSIEAVREDRIFEVKSSDILAPGPALLRGLRELHEIIQRYMTERK